jgi:hypothetical protein
MRKISFETDPKTTFNQKVSTYLQIFYA